MIRVAGDDQAAAIAVRDHGVGLAPGESAMVFNRFWRADPARARTSGGTGLGLSISLEDTHLHGGWLQAWGQPGEGAQFRLTLPRRAGGRRCARARCRWCRTTPRRPSDEPTGTPPRALARGWSPRLALLGVAGCVRMPDVRAGASRPAPARTPQVDSPIYIDPRPPAGGRLADRSSSGASWTR